MKGFVYILECSNGKFYTGSTRNLTQRLTAHWNGTGSNFTRKYPPKRLCYTAEFSSIKEAFAREQQIKKWSRAKKIALMQGDFDQLKWVSRSLSAVEMSVPRLPRLPRRCSGTNSGTEAQQPRLGNRSSATNPVIEQSRNERPSTPSTSLDAAREPTREPSRNDPSRNEHPKNNSELK